MSRAERRRAARAARKQAEFEQALEARRARGARRPASDPGDARPLVVRIAKAIWGALVRHERREFWQFAGAMSWIGRAMGIDTRDRRLPAWTGLNRDPGTPANPDKARSRRRAG